MLCSAFALSLVIAGVILTLECTDNACYEDSLQLKYVFGAMIIVGAALFAACITVDITLTATCSLLKNAVLCKCCRKRTSTV